MIPASSCDTSELALSFLFQRRIWMTSPSSSLISTASYACSFESATGGVSHASLISSVKRLRMEKRDEMVPPVETSLRR